MYLLHRHPALRRPPRTEMIAKPGGGSRRLIRLDPVDAATYRRLVAGVAPPIERVLGGRVIANRVSAPQLRLEEWRTAHRRWRRALTPGPGAVLANAVLHRLDAAIAEAGAPHVRWVDDVVAVARDRRHARRVLDAALRSLDELGLRPNAGKTVVEDHRLHASTAASFVPAAVR